MPPRRSLPAQNAICFKENGKSRARARDGRDQAELYDRRTSFNNQNADMAWTHYKQPHFSIVRSWRPPADLPCPRRGGAEFSRLACCVCCLSHQTVLSTLQRHPVHPGSGLLPTISTNFQVQVHTFEFRGHKLRNRNRFVAMYMCVLSFTLNRSSCLLKTSSTSKVQS